MKFAHPAWLILLSLPLLLALAAPVAAHMRRSRWAPFMAARLGGTLLKRGNPLAHWCALACLLAACAALTTALARPQGDAGTRTEKSLGRNVLIALDLSRSMRVSDVKPDRLSRAKMTIHELLEAMPDERFGLIGFAGSAYIHAPLTVDHGAVRETVDQIDEGWATLGGSNFGAAIRLGIDTLRETGQKNNALVILSDGEKHDSGLDDIIDQARQSGVYLIAIGVGTEDGDYVPHPDFPDGRMVDRSGQPVISRLQPELLRELASRTGGRFAVAGTGTDVAAIVRDVVKDLDAFEIQGRERVVAVEFHQWLVFPALIFLFAAILAATRWRAVTAMLATGILLTSPQARADAVSDAKRLLRNGDHAAARDAYRKLAGDTSHSGRKTRFHLGAALAAYRGGDYRGARESYSQALLSTDPETLGVAHLGMGRALFQTGWLALSGKSYPEDPAQPPPLADFDALVRAKLEEWRGEEQDGTGRMGPLITNWTDAVRHFESAHGAMPSDPAPRQNREMVMTYLIRLRELLEEDRQQTQDALPQPQPGGGQPQPGESGEPGEDGESGEGGSQGQPEDNRENAPGGRNTDPDEPPQDGREGGNEDEESPGKPSEDPENSRPDDGRESGQNAPRPGETPEERARRILRENADCEKGPLTPGRIEFNPPAKDW